VFERFPTGDAQGIFWTILHGLESLSGHYEAKVVASLKRSPSEFSLIMINRMLNAGEQEVGGVPLLPLLSEVAECETCPPLVRSRAQHLLSFQRRKTGLA
jgi:hypothetical protein